MRMVFFFCLSVYVLISFFGFFLFGDVMFDDVLFNFDTDFGISYSFLFNDVVRVSYVVYLMFVFFIVFYLLRLNLDGFFFLFVSFLNLDNLSFVLFSIGFIVVVFLGVNFMFSMWDVF